MGCTVARQFHMSSDHYAQIGATLCIYKGSGDLRSWKIETRQDLT